VSEQNNKIHFSCEELKKKNNKQKGITLPMTSISGLLHVPKTGILLVKEVKRSKKKLKRE